MSHSDIRDILDTREVQLRKVKQKKQHSLNSIKMWGGQLLFQTALHTPHYAASPRVCVPFTSRNFPPSLPPHPSSSPHAY